MLENTGYHESTSIAMTSTATPCMWFIYCLKIFNALKTSLICVAINTAMHWQESVPPLIHHPQHLDGMSKKYIPTTGH